MFLKKGQKLLTMGQNLLKSIYRGKNTFVYETKAEAEETDHG